MVVVGSASASIVGRRDVESLRAGPDQVGRIRDGQTWMAPIRLVACSRPARVEDRDLAELPEIEHVIPQDALLLPRLELRAADFHADRGQHPEVVVEILSIQAATCCATAWLPSPTDCSVPLRSDLTETSP